MKDKELVFTIATDLTVAFGGNRQYGGDRNKFLEDFKEILKAVDEAYNEKKLNKRANVKK